MKERGLRREPTRKRLLKYQVLPLDDDKSASPLQQQHSQPSWSHPAPHVTLTARRRAYILSRPIRNPVTVLPFRRALVRLRGVQLWTKLMDEVKIYGTGPGLMDQFRRYKKCLPDVMRRKRRIQRQISISETPVKVGIGGLFRPNTLWMSLWQMLVLGLLLYSFVIVPYTTAFVDGETMWDQVDIAVDVLFLLDILVTLNTALPGPQKTLITSRPVIFKSYLRGLLIPDIFSIFPFNILNIDSSGANSFARFSRLIKFVRLIRGTKLIRLLRHFTRSENMQKLAELMDSGITRLISTMYMVLLLVHLTACIWYLSAKLSNFSPDTWVVRKGIQDSEAFVLYMNSFYWAITTLATVGFGDIHAKTQAEMYISMAWMMFGVGFYSVIVGTLSSMLTSLDTRDVMINEKLQAVELYAKDTHLPESLYKEITKEIKLTAETTTLDEYQRFALLAQLSKPLRISLSLEMFDCAASKIAFFQEIDSACLMHVLPLLTRREVQAGVRLYSKGEYADEVYFVLEGRLACVYGPRHIAFKSVLQGAYWGEIELIDMVPREYTLMTEHQSDLLIMSKLLFETMMSEFPYVAQKIRDTARIRRTKIQECLNEVLDIYETVEVRKQATLEELPGKAKVILPKPIESDISSAVTDMMNGRTNEEVAVWLRREMAVMALEVEGMKAVAQNTLKRAWER